jgi:hypothetical protein
MIDDVAHQLVVTVGENRILEWIEKLEPAFPRAWWWPLSRSMRLHKTGIVQYKKSQERGPPSERAFVL